MSEETQEQEAPAEKLELSAEFSVEDAAKLTQAGRDVILRAAAKIAEADKIAADKIAAEKRKAELHEQSREGRKERQAAIAGA